MGQMFNGAAVTWGVSQQLTSNASKLMKTSGQLANALSKTSSVLESWGTRAGIAGYALSSGIVGGKLIFGNGISTAEGVNFGISTLLVGGALIAAGTAAAPIIGAAALIYGGLELGSYLYNGNTFEQNIIGK